MLQFTQLKARLLAPLVLTAVGLCACMEDELNFSTLNNEVMVGGSLTLPLGHSKITMQQVLDQYANKLEDVELHAGTGDVLTLYLDSLIYYEARDLSDGIANLVGDMLRFSVETPLLPVPVTIPLGGLTQTFNESFDFNGLNLDTSRQKINRLLLKDVKMNVHVDAPNYPSGFLSVSMTLPGDTTNTWHNFGNVSRSKDTTLHFSNLALKANGSSSLDYQVELRLANGSTTISPTDRVSITVSVDTFANFDYVVYGYFYYDEAPKYMDEPYNLNLFEYFPEGTRIGLCDPTINFYVSSNLGVPLTLTIDSLVPEHRIPTTHPALKITHQDLARANTPDDIQLDALKIDKSDFVDGADSISQLFNSDLKSFYAKYHFNPTYHSYGALPSSEKREQFIASNSTMTVKMSAEVPLYLDETSQLRLTDTMDIDLNFNNEYAISGNVDLLFTVKNALPIGVDTLKFTLLDSLYRPIAVSNPGDYYFVNLLPPDNSLSIQADTKDEVDLSTVKEYPKTISFDNGNIDELVKAKHLLVTVVALRPKNKDGKLERIKLTTKNYIDIKVGVSGSISAKGKVDALKF
jgi:hypothetical protein